MLLHADQILDSVLRELSQLQIAAGSTGEGSALQSLGLALKLLAAREPGGAATVHAQLRALAVRLDDIEPHLPPQGSLAVRVAQLRERIAQALTEPLLHGAEAAWREVVEGAQTLANEAAQSKALDGGSRARIAQSFCEWECADLRGQLGSGDAAATASSTEITRERWCNYLRDRFGEPGLEVPSFKSLAGGFGKQTYLFEVKGHALQGDFVLRRDLAITLFDNDCHRIEKEYTLIRAAFERGFPAPEALWLDTEHRLLAGGHFLVMRRSPGVSGGSVFQAQGAVPQDLADTLAGIMARLHTLPPMRELGVVTESVTPELWDMSTGRSCSATW